MVLEVNGLTKEFGETRALSDVSFAADAGEIVSILGPSGSGKTTLLKIIAGIETPTSGRVSFGEADRSQHPVIIVFQDYVLFPHLSVFENVAFGLRARKRQFDSKEIRSKVMDMLEYFDLIEKADSFPAHLSGGQKQRVAIARAMVLNPYVLLLDEPFANLDQNLKMDTAAFIRKTQKTFGITTIAVTHDQDEAFAMSDRLGVLLSGSVRQLSDPGTLYSRPSSIEVATFLGPVNHITMPIRELLTADGFIPSASGTTYARPEGLELVAGDESDKYTSRKKGTISNVRFSSNGVIYTVSTASGDGESSCRVRTNTDRFRLGDRVRLRLNTFFSIEK